MSLKSVAYMESSSNLKEAQNIHIRNTWTYNKQTRHKRTNKQPCSKNAIITPTHSHTEYWCKRNFVAVVAAAAAVEA